MASEEARKKWGTIFMGDREASVEQLNAMQEHLNRDKIQKEQTEDYMERVRQRAADRAREILGAAYTERQKVLEEAKGEAAVQKRLALQECAKIKAEGEEIRKQAEEELKQAQAEREEAERQRQAGHEEGYQAGLDQAGRELHEFRAELGQSVAVLMRSIERQRKTILENWRNDLVDLVKATAQAGTGYILQKEHEAILQNLTMQALDLLENKSAISLRVNPADEEAVSDMFRAARDRAPELKQWTVTGDESIERGGVVADSGTGSVDFRRSNFREMVESILCHLGLPEQASESREEQDMARLVEQEVAHIASLTPELDQPEAPLAEAEPEQVAAPEQPAVEEIAEAPDEVAAAENLASVELPTISPELAEMEDELLQGPVADDLQPAAPDNFDEMPEQASGAVDPGLAALEDELFPLEEETEAPELNSQQEPEPKAAAPAKDASHPAPNKEQKPAAKSAQSVKPAQAAPKAQTAKEPQKQPAKAPDAAEPLDAKILSEGGFL